MERLAGGVVGSSLTSTTAATFFSVVDFFSLGSGGWVTTVVSVGDPGDMNDADDEDDDGVSIPNWNWMILLGRFNAKLVGLELLLLSEMSENSLNWVNIPASKLSCGLTIVFPGQYSLWGMHQWSYRPNAARFGVWIHVGVAHCRFLFFSISGYSNWVAYSEFSVGRRWVLCMSRM